MADYPRLDLYFDTDQGRLKDARFKASARGIVDRRFCQAGSDDSLFVAELCIVILLAKLRGTNPDNPNQPIRFQQKSERSSWLKAFGVAIKKETHRAFFDLCFGQVAFITGNRGGGHNKRKEKPEDEIYSFADYHPKELPLENVRIYEHDAKEEVELSPEEIEDLLREVEKSGIKAGYGWDSVIGEYIQEVKAARPDHSGEQGRQFAAENMLGVKVSDLQNDLLNDLSKQIEKRRDQGTWYVLSSIPSYLGQWKRKFCNTILIRGSDVQYLHVHDFAEKDRAAKLWMGNASGKNAADLEQRTSEAMRELSEWVRELKADMAKHPEFKVGTFEYGLTNVNLPYIAILFDPAESKKSKLPFGRAPKGAWCAISLCSINPAHLGEHRALYLENPNPLLDEYYTSIKRFFAYGREGKHRLDTVGFDDPLKGL